MPGREAIVAGAKARFRPILLTSDDHLPRASRPLDL